MPPRTAPKGAIGAGTSSIYTPQPASLVDSKRRLISLPDAFDSTVISSLGGFITAQVLGSDIVHIGSFGFNPDMGVRVYVHYTKTPPLGAAEILAAIPVPPQGIFSFDLPLVVRGAELAIRVSTDPMLDVPGPGISFTALVRPAT